ncbi:MAG: tRNA pseudouridine(38-40) synthase TruA [Rhabdochlamydiaceae bacterium]
MKNFKIVISYDGTAYLGWQQTPFGSSIQETCQQAFTIACRQPVLLEAASRTDKGVHAKHQVLQTTLHPPYRSLRSLQHSVNCLLPKDIVVQCIEETDFSFHPSLDAKSKEYTYLVCTKQFQSPFQRFSSWHFPFELSIQKMQEGASFLVGQHDFTALANKSVSFSDPCKEIYDISIREVEPGCFLFTILGNSFLYKMVRNIAGLLVYVGCSRFEADQIPHLLESKNRQLAPLTAPAHGLTLNRIFYDM